MSKKSELPLTAFPDSEGHMIKMKLENHVTLFSQPTVLFSVEVIKYVDKLYQPSPGYSTLLDMPNKPKKEKVRHPLQAFLQI